MRYRFRIRDYFFAIAFLLTSASAQEKEQFPEEFQKLCDSPLIYVCEHFLSEEECNYLIEVARPELVRTTVIDLNSANNLVDAVRTSFGMFISSPCEDEMINRLEQRISEITNIPVENGENMQVLYYPVGGEYLPHYDTFDPQTPGGRIHYNRGGQRVATFMVYLNTPEEGGETIFPRVNLKITPEKGKAVLFFNVDETEKTNLRSLHGGAPVIKGEKWLITKWLREREFY